MKIEPYCDAVADQWHDEITGKTYKVISCDNALLDIIGPTNMYETCFDYVDCAVYDEETKKYGIVVFVEPCGNLIKFGKSLKAVSNWWSRVFETQPDNMDFIEAGWHLAHFYEHPTLWALPPELIWNKTGRQAIKIGARIARAVNELIGP